MYVRHFYNVSAQMTQYYSKKMEDIVLKYQDIANFVLTLIFTPFSSMDCVLQTWNVVSMLPFNISPHQSFFGAPVFIFV